MKCAWISTIVIGSVWVCEGGAEALQDCPINARKYTLRIASHGLA